MLFARKWMLRALRTLRRDYGISPVKSAKVESRKQLTPDEYRALVEGNGFKITKQRIEKVQVPLDGWRDISGIQDFIEGVMPGVPLEIARECLQQACKETWDEMGLDTVPRNWMMVVASRA